MAAEVFGKREMHAAAGTARWTSTIARVAAGVCAFALAAGLMGCVFTTPARSEVERETVEPSLSASDLVEDGYLTVAMDTTDAPQAMSGTDGAPTGYYADLAQALSERLGLDLKIVSSADPAGSVTSGKADIFIGAATTDATSDVAISDSILEDASAVFTKTADGSNNAPTVSAQNMSGTTVAVQDSSASQDALARAGISAAQSTYPNINKCFEALASDEVKYVACDATSGAYLARAYQGTVFVGTIANVSTYGVAAVSGSAVCTTVFDELDTMQNDGTIESLRHFWYGSLPASLSSALLEGVTLTSDSNTDDADTANAEGESSEDGLTVSGDINSLG